MLDNISGIVNSINAQQAKLDILGNNIANISSTAYKKNKATFGDLFYNSAYVPGMPVSENVRIGGGAMIAGTEKDFSQGSLMQTGRQLDLAVEGDGFFGITLPDGSLGYSRDGNFHLDPDHYIVNSQGNRLFTDMDLPFEYQDLTVTDSGEIRALLPEEDWSTVGTIPLFHIPNPAGLEAVGTGLYRETEAAGSISQGIAGTVGFGNIKQGYLEQSNVELGEEMANLIVTQRAFQFSCQAMRTLDDMWGLANNLQR